MTTEDDSVAETMLENMIDDILLIMSDEAYFHLPLMGNKQNFM